MPNEGECNMSKELKAKAKANAKIEVKHKRGTWRRKSVGGQNQSV